MGVVADLSHTSPIQLLAGLMSSRHAEKAAEVLTLSRGLLANVVRLDSIQLQECGLTPTEANRIHKAFELSRRAAAEQTTDTPTQITSSVDAFDVLKPHLSHLAVEQFWVLILDRANNVIKAQCLSTGGASGCIADPKLIFRAALAMGASGVVVAHNHPSGNTRPSQADNRVTEQLVTVGEALDCPVLDHIIVGKDQYYSFADSGQI